MALIILDESNNIYQGIGESDIVLGLAGTDFLQTSKAGASAAFGNTDNDLLIAGGIGDTLAGGKDNDNLTSQQGRALMFGDDDEDTIAGGSAGNDTMLGGAGDDSLVGNGPSLTSSPLDSIFGATQPTAANSNNWMFGNAGDDTLQGGGSKDSLFGGQGNDSISAFINDADNITSRNNFISGDVGSDTITGGGAGDTLLGDYDPSADAGDDSITSGVGDKILMFGNAGNDTLVLASGAGGGSSLYGGKDNDFVDGSQADSGDDSIDGNYLSGDNGNDTVIAAKDTDTISGGAGNDSLDLNQTLATAVAGDGNDTISGSGGGAAINGGDGDDSLVGAAGDNLLGAGGNDNLELLNGAGRADGGDGNDVVTGNIDGDDTLFGSLGNDALFGRGGADIVSGGSGNDSIYGQGGNDALTGGDGADGFFYVSQAAGVDADVISDFVSGTDRIYLKSSVFTGLGDPAFGNAVRFVTPATLKSATGAAIVYDATAKTVSFDADGRGTAAGSVLLFTLSGSSTAVTGSDFVLF